MLYASDDRDSEILAFIRGRININVRWIIWHYTNKVTPSLNHWQRTHESILCCSKEKPHFNRDDVREPYTDTFLKNAAGKVRKATKGRFSNGETETTYNAHANGALPRDVIKISGDDVAELGFQAQASSSASTPGSIISVSTASNASSALTTIDTAINTIANTRSKFGAGENAIDSRLNYLLNAKTNSSSRLSKIEDADFALETARLTKAQIMSKAASSMLAQANARSEVFLKLIN